MDWSADVDAKLRADVIALLETQDLKYWHALMTVMHPGIVMFAEATLRRAIGSRSRFVFEQPGRPTTTQLHELALDVALRVCADLRKNGFRRLTLFQGLQSRDGAPFRGYIAKITRNTTFRYLRTQVLRPEGGRREVTSEAQSVGPQTLDRMQPARGQDTGARTARHIIEREKDLQLLSAAQRDVLELYLTGYSAAEIAALRSPPTDAAAVQHIIRSAKAKLKYHFGEQRNER